MTTIAWDGKTLAGDKRATNGNVINSAVTKVLRRKDGSLIASSGNFALGSAYMRWFLKGEKGKKPPLKVDEEEGYLLIVRKNGTVERHEPEGWFPVVGRVAAGSGQGLALLAMDMGATAAEAVKLASKYDAYTGPEVDTVTRDASVTD